MKILIVCNNAYMRGNGICTAVLSLVSRLQKVGIEARIMSCANPDLSGKQPEYPLSLPAFVLNRFAAYKAECVLCLLLKEDYGLMSCRENR